MNRSLLVRLASLPFVLTVWGARAEAQCVDAWAEGFQTADLDGQAHSLAAYDDGSGHGPALYVGGDFVRAGGQAAARIARWDGTGWSTLGSGLDNRVRALCVYDDGSGPALYAGGSFVQAGAQPVGRIARWDGASWSSVGGGVGSSFDSVNALAVYDDGSGPALYAAGQFSSAGGVPANRIARWDGSAWSALGSGVLGVAVHALAVHDDGSGPALYATGQFHTAGGSPANNVARWNGTSWSTLGSGIPAWGIALAVHDDGTGPALYVGGDFTQAGGAPASNIARWDGAGWSPVGGGTDHRVQALCSFDDGTAGGPVLYAGGHFQHADGAAARAIARWDGASWSSLGFGLDGENNALGGNNNDVNALLAGDVGGGPELFVAGRFLRAGPLSAGNVARWSGSAWSALASSNATSGAVVALAVDASAGAPVLYVGGVFVSAGDVAASRVARFDGVSWSALAGPEGEGVNGQPSQFGAGGGVSALALFDDGTGTALYVGGSFATAGGVEARNVARWDGSSWSRLDEGLNDQVRALLVHDDGTGPALYAAGKFTASGGTPLQYVARWDGTAWTALGSGLTAFANALASVDHGQGPRLYVGGEFFGAGGGNALRVARWDGASWSSLGADAPNDDVHALAAFDDGSGPALYVGGFFSAVGGVPAARVARFDGASWSTLGAGIGGGTLPLVDDLRVVAESSGPALYAGGRFESAGGASASNVARWDGTAWSPLDAGVDGQVYALAGFPGTVGAGVYVGGAFSHAGGLPAAHLARRSNCVEAYPTFCFGDGSSGACPCGNAGLPGHGCDNSAATGGGLLAASGSTSPDAISLAASSVLPTALTIFTQGTTALPAAVPFGDGLRCVGGSLKRLAARNASGGAVTYPLPGDESISDRSAALGDPLTQGSTRHYYAYYRDPDLAFCAPPQGQAWSITNAVTIVW